MGKEQHYLISEEMLIEAFKKYNKDTIANADYFEQIDESISCAESQAKQLLSYMNLQKYAG